MEEPDFPRREPGTPQTHQSCPDTDMEEFTTWGAEQGEGTQAPGNKEQYSHLALKSQGCPRAESMPSFLAANATRPTPEAAQGSQSCEGRGVETGPQKVRVMN